MKMKYKSEAVSESDECLEDAIVFFDIEVFPNLLLVNWKYAGPQCKCVRMINPSQQDIAELLKKKLVGFNCRRYDNHILYARYLGKSIEEIYEISQAIISGDKAAMFGQAYNISYTDVYDFSSKSRVLRSSRLNLVSIIRSSAFRGINPSRKISGNWLLSIVITTCSRPKPCSMLDRLTLLLERF